MTLLPSIRRQPCEGGFTLLELLLVIGVAALLLIGGIATYRLVSDGNRSTEATRLLLTIRQEAQTMAQQNGGTFANIGYDSTANDEDNVFVASGILRNQQRNPFNGNILIASNGAATPPNSELEITFESVTRSSCVKLFTAITNPSEITGVTVNGGTQVLADNSGTNDLTSINAATNCSQPTNTIMWTVK